MLSDFSVRWDIPLKLYQADVQELRTGTRQFSYRTPFDEVTIKGQFERAADKEFITYASIYREAITTDSSTYQFLCLYRLIESIRARRVRLGREAKKQGRTYTVPVEIFPKDATEATTLLNNIFLPKPSHADPWTLSQIVIAEAAGKTINDIVSVCLRSIRDNIAHIIQ